MSQLFSGKDNTWKKDIPARKSALSMAITGTKQVARALWRSSRGLLWGAGWRIRQLWCPALRKDLCKSEDKERHITDTSELRSERLYFRIEWICRTGIKVGLNGESRLICISTETAVYIDMTAWRSHKIPLKAVLCSPPVKFLADGEHAKFVFTW